MVRPRLDQERVTQDVAINIANIQENNTNPSLNPVFSSTGGNVALRPYQSTNIDMSLEKYFPAGGYVALAGYYKHLTDYVDPNKSSAYDFSSLLGSVQPAHKELYTRKVATPGGLSD